MQICEKIRLWTKNMKSQEKISRKLIWHSTRLDHSQYANKIWRYEQLFNRLSAPNQNYTKLATKNSQTMNKDQEKSNTNNPAVKIMKNTKKLPTIQYEDVLIPRKIRYEPRKIIPLKSQNRYEPQGGCKWTKNTIPNKDNQEVNEIARFFRIFVYSRQIKCDSNSKNFYTARFFKIFGYHQTTKR